MAKTTEDVDAGAGRPGLWLAALIVAAVNLGPALAHLLALPNKMDLGAEAYLIAQVVYRGWSLLAVVVALTLASTIALAVSTRRAPRVFPFVCFAVGAIVASQVLFWLFTYPANVATEQWTRLPSEWRSLRARWELSHAAAAGLDLLAFIAIAAGALRRR